jgi:mannose-1-phosphate guanylyltransferase/mannose-6-phosphate isomerase
MIVPVILAGGAGERLWPLSKVDYPKQFLPLEATGASLFGATLTRVADRVHFAAPVIVCHHDHRFIVDEQLRTAGIRDATIITEPASRNTAPAIAMAALHLETRAPGGLMLVLPSDHRIEMPHQLMDAVTRAETAAMRGAIVTFGITPDSPQTGYGYIAHGEADDGIYSIARFIEKPDADTARALVAGGRCSWNSGIFFARPQTILEQLRLHAPELYRACAASYAQRRYSGASITPDDLALASCPSIAFDRAVMEHCNVGMVVPVAMGWSDLGSWTAFDAASRKDADGNACIGRTVTEDVAGCYLRTDGALIAAIGLRDMVVIAADNAVMIGPKDRMQDVKQLLDKMRDSALPDTHRTMFAHRPWGGFTQVSEGTNYRVKKLHIHPGGQLSLQAHQHRCEHWVVVQGVATVTRDEQVVELARNESTFIAAGHVHRLENRGEEELIVIEVQTGDHLGEDDITRFEDAYSRS